MGINFQDKCGAAWKKTSGNGNAFMSMSITKALPEGAQVVMFPNRNKKTANHPDFEMFWDGRVKGQQQQQQQTQTPKVELNDPWGQ